MVMLNNFTFIALPYIAIVTFLVGSVYRYRSRSFKYSSLSSQFLEGKNLFWGSVPFHWGIIVVFLGHLVAFFIPEGILMWNRQPVRLLILESTGLAFGFSVFIGLMALFYRRLTNPRVKMVTNKMDLVIEILLLSQVVLGLWVALGYRWGSSWFASDLTPYLWSIFKFNPSIAAVSEMPLVIKLHITGAFLIILVFPFTRLVHFLVAPFHYIWRPYQKVMWNYDHKKIRQPTTPWTKHRPKNN